MELNVRTLSDSFRNELKGATVLSHHSMRDATATVSQAPTFSIFGETVAVNIESKMREERRKLKALSASARNRND